jgi:hypothetical protein
MIHLFSPLEIWGRYTLPAHVVIFLLYPLSEVWQFHYLLQQGEWSDMF